MKKKLSFASIRHVLGKRIWDLVFLIWVLAGLPILSIFVKYMTAPSFRVRNIVYSLAFALVLFILSIGLTKWQRKTILWIVYVGSFLPAFIVLSYMNIASTFLMSGDFIPVFATNVNESLSFVDQFVNYSLLFFWLGYFVPPALYLFIFNAQQPAFVFLQIKNTLIKYRAICVWPLVVMICLFCFKPDRLQHMYFSDFYRSYYLYAKAVRRFSKLANARKINVDARNLGHFNELLDRRADASLFTVTKSNDTAKKVFVVVVGESFSKHHSSLYNYPRPTNPLLSMFKNELLVYNDVVSGATDTNQSLQLVLTFSDNKHLDYYFTKPTIIELFNTAGFKSYWISTQQLTGIADNLYGVVAQGADVLNDLSDKSNKEKDGAVLNLLDSALQDSSSRDKVIFIHLNGSHTAYTDRYLPPYKKFTDASGIVTKMNGLTTEQLNTINEYDNSILYNDYVVNSVIDRLKKNAPFSYMLYFSDHGDEVYDFRDLFGHRLIGSASHYMCEIPFMLWRSERYKKAVNLDIDLNRPYDTEDLIYSISQLSGLSYADYDSTRSIFSKSFKSKERLVAGITYDSLLRRFPGK